MRGSSRKRTKTWDGGHAFGKKLAREIVLLAKVQEDDLVKNLRKEIKDYQDDIKRWNRGCQDELYHTDHYCLYCCHRREILVEDMQRDNMIPSCPKCNRFLPCKEWCVEMRRMDRSKCPKCDKIKN